MTTELTATEINLGEQSRRLLVYLNQHGFGVAYELWPDRTSVVWVVRPVDKLDCQKILALQDPCQTQLYLSFSRHDVPLVQENSRAARST